MFLRKKLNKSGVISVQIIDKSSGKYKLIKTIGSSSDIKAIEKLVIKAEEFIQKSLGAIELDFNDYESIYNRVLTSITSHKLVGIELVLGKLFDEIGFNQIEDELFRDLVLYRLVYPKSKLKTTEYLHRFAQKKYSEDDIYRYLDKLYQTQKETVQQISYAHTLTILQHKINLKSGKLTKTSINNRGYKKFLQMTGDVQLNINQDKIKEDEKWDGLKGYITNSTLSKEKILDNYKQLWQIEKAFRIAKTDLKI